MDRVWVITGENAGGKSIFCRAVQRHVMAGPAGGAGNVEVMRVGMDMRTEAGIRRGLMFGSENDGSTGKNSVSTVLAGIRTARGREHPHWLVFDEPDVGVGEGYRAALGELFVRFARDLPRLTGCFAVVTHAREIARPLVEAGASSVRVGSDLRPVREWLRDGDLPKTVEELEALPGRATETLRAVGRVLEALRAERAGRKP